MSRGFVIRGAGRLRFRFQCLGRFKITGSGFPLRIAKLMKFLGLTPLFDVIISCNFVSLTIGLAYN